MKNITKDTLHLFCRTCLTELQTRRKHNISCMEEQVRQWLQDCALQSDYSDDSFPKYVCPDCYNKLKDFLEFRKMCCRSRRILLDILLKERNKQTHMFQSDIGLEMNVPLKQNKEDLSEVSGDKDWLKCDCATNEESTEDKGTSSDNDSTTIDRTTNLNDVDLNGVNSKISEQMESSVDHFDHSYDSSFENDDSDKNRMNTLCENRGLHTKVNDVKVPKRKYDSEFVCKQCQCRFYSKEKLQMHMRIHKEVKSYHQCHQCDRDFSKSNYLRQHMTEAHAKKKNQMEIVCDHEDCGRVFGRKASYKLHYRLKHTQEAERIHNPYSYMCEDCGRIFKNMSRLREHRYQHMKVEDYPFQCNQCHKGYTTQRSFRDHQLRHAGIKNFECPFCGMKKTTRNELKTHINYHTKERQWPCSKCTSVFNSSANLGLHDRIVHKGIRRFACRYCDQSFAKSDTLKHHEMRHTGEKPHVCSICNKCFIQLVALRAHMKTHRKPLPLESTQVVPEQSQIEITCLSVDNGRDMDSEASQRD